MHYTHIFLQLRRSIYSSTGTSKIIILLIGGVVGFLSGLLGKGGSAITTPALQIFAGINPFAALASPLPATLPTTLSASVAYSRENLINRRVVVSSILLGIPATFLGSFFSDWLGGNMLMILTAIFVLSLGVSFFLISSPPDFEAMNKIEFWKITTVALSVGFLSGLLANSGGVLFGPLFIRFLKMPTKQALASSLLVAAGLAIPGTIAHWYLGHINWQIVLLLSVSSIPFSYLGARLAVRLQNIVLERIFGIMLVAFGGFDLWYSLVH
jgi:uncharacterized protein